MRKHSTYFLFIVLLFMLTGISDSFGQDIADHNWYFGNSTRAIRFSRSTNLPTLINNKAPLNLGGTAVATDQFTGNLLFYTDGVTVFNSANAQMPNGGGLNGAPQQNQPVVITKSPDIENQFYIFHRDVSGEVFFSIVDMKLFGGSVFPSPPLGDVTATKNSTTGLLGMSEAMISIPHANGNDFWILTHAAGTTNYIATLVTNAGAVTPQPPAPAGLITSAANFSYHSATGMIAVAPNEAFRNVEILSFDKATGAVAFVTEVPNSGTLTATGGDAIYDTEWSNTGQFLYISRHHGDTGPPLLQADVVQFDTRNPTTTLTSVLPQPNTIFRSYGLQMAPDSSIYHLYQTTLNGPLLLGAMTDPDTVAALTAYVPQAFPGNVNFSAEQFSSFAPADTVGITLIDFDAAGLCSGAPTTFYPEVKPFADSLQWDFGDGTTASGWSPVHIYQDGGSYPVTVNAFLNGSVVASIQKDVAINQFDLTISLSGQETACTCELAISHRQPPYPYNVPGPGTCTPFSVTAQISGTATSMQWYGPDGLMAGQTTATLTGPPEAGYYYLVATDGSGCSTYAGVTINEWMVPTNRANVWFFGNNAGLDFNPVFQDPPQSIGTPTWTLSSLGGSAVVCDLNGEIIFSTNGTSVHDRNGADITPSPNPPGIGGESVSTQSALIIPVPGDATLFYIFTTQQVYGANTYELRYSLFDHKLNNGTGGISRFNELLFTKSTERITSDGNWLIAHEYGNNSFRAYEITQQGIGNPVISGIGSDHSFTVEANGQGYMEFGGNNQLVVALSNPGVSNSLEIFDFDRTTGVVSNFHAVNLKQNAGQVYGVEFSGGKILATIKDPGPPPLSKIVEVFFDVDTIPHLVRQPPILVNEELGSIQTDPLGTVQVAVNGAGSLGTIQVNPDTLLASTFILAGQPLGGNTSGIGLPNFIGRSGNQTQGPSIAIVGQCVDAPVTFTGTPTDPIDTFDWAITDNLGNVIHQDDQATFQFTFDTPGVYSVRMVLSNKCKANFEVVDQAFTINANPPPPVVGTPIICTGPVQLSAYPVNDPTLTYLWDRTGETTNTITTSQPGPYSVTVTNAAGCTSVGNGFVGRTQPVLDLSPDVTICQGVALPDLDALNPTSGNTYAWSINGGPTIGTAQTQGVDTSNDGVFNYSVTVTSGLCSLTVSKRITINPTPVFNSIVTNPACGSNNGQIVVDIQSPASGTFSYFVVGPAGFFFAESGQTVGLNPVPSLPTLAAGGYIVHVEDQLTTCAPPDQQPALSNATFVVSNLAMSGCNPSRTLTVTHTAGAALPLTYQLIDVTTGTVVAQDNTPTPRTSPSFTIPNITTVDNHQYQLTLSSTCSFTTPAQTFNQTLAAINPAATVINACVDPITVTVTGVTAGNVYTWFNSNNVQIGTGATLSFSPPTQGPQTYRLHITGAPGFCDNDVQIPVNVNTATLDFAQDTKCANQTILSATITPPGSYQYTWFESTAQGGPFTAVSSGAPVLTLQATSNGRFYRIDAVNTVTGCPFQSPVKLVEILGVLTVSAQPPTSIPCEGTQFTITTTASQPSGVLTYVWSLNGTVIPNQSGPTLTDTRGGEYVVDVNFSICPAQARTNVFPRSGTPGELSDNALICPDPANPDPNTRQVVLDAGIGFQGYQWFKDETQLIGETSQTYTAIEGGLYSVTLTNIFGCESTDETQVDVECEPRIVAPTAFRPASDVEVGGEHTNREFEVLTFFISDEDFQVFIFNRWGEMIFQSNDRLFTWNGGYNNMGALLPAGTYSYVVRYKSTYRPEDGVKEKRGGVVLVR